MSHEQESSEQAGGDRSDARHESPREHVHRVLDEAAQPEPDRESQQRNVGIAIAVLAAVVVLLLLAIVSGATDAFQP
jgi:hypothetical protein